MRLQRLPGRSSHFVWRGLDGSVGFRTGMVVTALRGLHCGCFCLAGRSVRRALLARMFPRWLGKSLSGEAAGDFQAYLSISAPPVLCPPVLQGLGSLGSTSGAAFLVSLFRSWLCCHHTQPAGAPTPSSAPEGHRVTSRCHNLEAW